jgi:hypothetical protein
MEMKENKEQLFVCKEGMDCKIVKHCKIRYAHKHRDDFNLSATTGNCIYKKPTISCPRCIPITKPVQANQEKQECERCGGLGYTKYKTGWGSGRTRQTKLPREWKKTICPDCNGTGKKQEERIKWFISCIKMRQWDGDKSNKPDCLTCEIKIRPKECLYEYLEDKKPVNKDGELEKILSNLLCSYCSICFERYAYGEKNEIPKAITKIKALMEREG